MESEQSRIEIREAIPEDRDFVLDLMDTALSPYYGGDHRAHGERIFLTHVSGGADRLGYFSFEQKMFILTMDSVPAGMIHLVGKRQQTYKVSPLIVSPEHRGKRGLGSALLNFAEQYVKRQAARQIYCTVAEQNNGALQFFIRKGFIVAGRSASHYKNNITEVMLYKLFANKEFEEKFDRPNISVLTCEEHHEPQIRQLLLEMLPRHFRGIDSSWVDALFSGYRRRDSRDVNAKYKLIFVAVDRKNKVLGVTGATPKKGEPIKLMPFLATSPPAFVALLTDVPFLLKAYGRKLYIHITPTVEETVALQQRGWKIDAVMPASYHDDHVTQQWSLDIAGEDFMRLMRVKQNFFDFIKRGEKTLEVRVGYDSIQTIQPGERLKLASYADNQIIRVKDIRKYPNFQEMITHEEPGRIAPGRSRAEVVALLKDIYPPEREALGVVVLEIESL